MFDLHPKRQEIDHRTIKLLVGLIALLIAPLTYLFSNGKIDSISASYYEFGWSSTIFVGFLFAIASLIASYNGESAREMKAAKVAAICAVGIGLVPCDCPGHPSSLGMLHFAFAAVMFLILAYFCKLFRERAAAKGTDAAEMRKCIYTVCGIIIILSIFAIVVAAVLTGGKISETFPKLIFWVEAAGLSAFGISWLTASRVIPWLAAADERFSPLREINPE